MQQSAQLQPSTDDTSFAGLLAALAGSRAEAQGARSDASRVVDDDLEDDVATLSYERALKAHARYRPSGGGDWPLSPAADADSMAGADAPVSETTSKTGSATNAGASRAAAVNASSVEKLEQSRRRASVTIRLSREECAQLQQRAAEAGLTISAYLRSCTFEVEALRAQVKQTLAELRAAQAPLQCPAPWWRRMLRTDSSGVRR